MDTFNKNYQETVILLTVEIS
uniref:Uncharacterized protein n=1 Tax=Arundo donax TaxID=35708 RepID=A0A0A9C824_ARUDO